MTWQLLAFKALSTDQLYELLALRAQVFVVEQHCAYQDIDGIDRDDKTYHLLGYQNHQLVAYLRLMAPSLLPESVNAIKYAKIGRVVTSPDARGRGLGHQLLEQSLIANKQLWANPPLYISAQKYLLQFYRGYGFIETGDEYLEDGIPHIAMIRTTAEVNYLA
ncbi:GNAT family N-acetyltransferase [Aquirhabdus parva]|uniref:GNAT family N-acetyltransferase n=2 Tax=Aquirhabdus parva TaxID=2283318 RepID=A0A345PB57_9GAMM|nr:GNAT family N-acetyltransferase [Aquirhabdus parva]